MKKVALRLSTLLLLSSCYAQSMHLEEATPWGPTQEGIQIQLTSNMSDRFVATEQRLLEGYFGENQKTSDWLLTLKLQTKTAPLRFPWIWGRKKAAERLRMEIEATGTLSHNGETKQSYVWKAQGDTVPEKEDILTARLLERLNGQIYHALGPRYVYE